MLWLADLLKRVSPWHLLNSSFRLHISNTYTHVPRFYQIKKKKHLDYSPYSKLPICSNIVLFIAIAPSCWGFHSVPCIREIKKQKNMNNSEEYGYKGIYSPSVDPCWALYPSLIRLDLLFPTLQASGILSVTPASQAIPIFRPLHSGSPLLAELHKAGSFTSFNSQLDGGHSSCQPK